MQRDMSSADGGAPVKQLVWALAMEPDAGDYFVRFDKPRTGSPVIVYAGTKDRMKKLSIWGGVFNSTITLSEASAASGKLVETTLFPPQDAPGEILCETARINVEAWREAHAF